MGMLIGFIGGLMVAVVAGFVMRKMGKQAALNAIFDLDWDMDGEKAEFLKELKDKVKKKIE